MSYLLTGGSDLAAARISRFTVVTSGKFPPLPSDKASISRIVSRSTTKVSQWVSLDSVTAMMPGAAEASVYHAIGQADYVQVLCQHQDGGIVLVRQYRPVVDQWTIEFPGGLREGREEPAIVAQREVEEETGLTVTKLIPLIDIFADVGRLTNRWFGFFAIVSGKWRSAEVGIESLVVSGEEVRRLAASGGLSAPGNIALLHLAATSSEVRDTCLKLGLVLFPWVA
jgi:8-oxo-dGTP pyrophosphatase MutT (NUDIX family)